MMAMTICVVVTLTQTVQLVTFASVMLMAFAAVLKILAATTTTACALDLMSHATFQVMTTASTVVGKIVNQVVEGWITMATVLTNTQSVVMVEENTSVDATVTLIVPTQSTQLATLQPTNAQQWLERFSSTQ